MRETLKIISRQHRDTFNKRRGEALDYAYKKQIPVKRMLEDGRVVELQYLDKKGLPVYHTTFNAGASSTVSTDSLYPGGGLGLNLMGSNYFIGVWDSGSVDSTHKEFDSRMKSKDWYDEPDDHATHVAGTIAAGGINSNARGMAFGSELISYNWNNYLSEVAMEAANGLLVSNHSYGIQLGWTRDDDGWEWNGAPDADEDYRFGFYNSYHSRSLDEIAFEAPGILMVWAAGNARNGNGDGTKEPNGPYDCIGPEAIAKNVLAVGAVNKISGGYSKSSDVVMTGFSSWGPSDDGRVKPDIVAPGYLLFSALPGDSYGYLSGTSMAAPVVSGSLLMLQEHYYDINKYHMNSASLKGLVIHTAYETGESKGPDYSFGWGMLNTSAAAELISNEDGESVFIKELALNQDELYEFSIYSDGLSDITGTLSWTDPPGPPPASYSLNPSDLMLINDLDISIKDDAGNIYLPWVLDPDEPSYSAETGDNYRDNVEKIFLTNPEPRKYTITISHKDDLKGGSQDFSLIFTASARESAGQSTLYWTGGNGDWNDPGNWSFTSGGIPAQIIPDAEICVVIDENSFSAPSQRLVVDAAAACRSFSWLSKEENGIAFTGYDISVHTDFILSGKIDTTGEDGMFVFRGESGSIFNSNNTDDALRFAFDNEHGDWEFLGDIRAESLLLQAGNVFFPSNDVYIGSFTVEGSKSKNIHFSGTNLYISGKVDLLSDDLIVNSDDLNVIIDLPERENTVNFLAGPINMAGINIFNGTLEMKGDFDIDDLINKSVLKLHGDNLISHLVLDGGSETWLEGGSEQVLSGFTVNSSIDSNVLLHSLSGQSAKIKYMDYTKLCFDHMDIYNVAAMGDAVYGAGKGSMLFGDTSGWQEGPCEDILFAGFDVYYPCVHSLTGFLDRSEGNVETWLWDFGDDNAPGDTSTARYPEYTYRYEGDYNVMLTVSDYENVTSLVKEVTISENTLAANEIFINNDLNKYVSIQTAPSYQWYHDGSPIQGATGRTLNMEGRTGEIRVLLADEKCNRFSEILVLSIEENYQPDNGILIYPNPAGDIFNVEITNSYLGKLFFEIVDVSGKVIHSFSRQKTERVFNTGLYLGIWPEGVYVIRIKAGEQFIMKKFLKE